MKKTFGVLVSIFLICAFAVPVFAADVNAENAPNIKSNAAIVMDADTGEILFGKNMHQRMYPASITKIMTGLVALEQGNRGDKLAVSSQALNAVGGNRSGWNFKEGEQFTLEEALFALSIDSSNDMANAIAEFSAGSQSRFAELMNQKAKAVGAANTHFTNAHGLPNQQHYTTAYDMAKITQAALGNPSVAEVFGENQYFISSTNLTSQGRALASQNKLLNGQLSYEGMIMSKTGWTPQANFTLASAAQRGDRTLICIVLDSPQIDDKWYDTMSLFDYGFEQQKVLYNKAG